MHLFWSDINPLNTKDDNVTMTRICFFYLYLQMDLYVDRQFNNPDYLQIGKTLYNPRRAAYRDT